MTSVVAELAKTSMNDIFNLAFCKFLRLDLRLSCQPDKALRLL